MLGRGGVVVRRGCSVMREWGECGLLRYTVIGICCEGEGG